MLEVPQTRCQVPSRRPQGFQKQPFVPDTTPATALGRVEPLPLTFKAPLASLPLQLRRTGPTRVLSDDVTVVVVDILPAASDGPVPSFMGGSDAAAPKRGLFRMLRCFSKGASGVTEPRQAAAKSMARMKEDGPTTLSNGLIIPAGVEPGNTKFLFGDNDSDTSSNHEQSDTQSDMRFGRRSDTVRRLHGGRRAANSPEWGGRADVTSPRCYGR